MRLIILNMLMCTIISSALLCCEQSNNSSGQSGARDDAALSPSDVTTQGAIENSDTEELPLCEERLTENDCKADAGTAQNASDPCLWLPVAHFEDSETCGESLDLEWKCTSVVVTGDGACGGCPGMYGSSALSYFTRADTSGSMDVLGYYGCGYYQPVGWEPLCKGAVCDCFCDQMPDAP